MTRKEELEELCGDNKEIKRLVEEVVFLEEQLEGLRKLPFYKIHPTDAQKQRVLPAAKLYKEMLQQYTNCLKLLSSATRDADGAEESPLRIWIRERREKYEKNAIGGD